MSSALTQPDTPEQSKSQDEVHSGIGVRNEKSLHAAIKQWYARPGDRLEVKVDGYVVDIVRDDLLIEIQTRNLSALRHKLRALTEQHPVRLVYPIAKNKWIVHLGRKGRVQRRRKSPRTGRLIDLFDELVSLPDLINRENFTLEILLIREEEVRRQDGKGSWRRRGVSILDRKLVDVAESIRFESKQDFRRFLPRRCRGPFSNRSLAADMGYSIYDARRITYCLRKMELIREVGKNGRELLFEIME